MSEQALPQRWRTFIRLTETSVVLGVWGSALSSTDILISSLLLFAAFFVGTASAVLEPNLSRLKKGFVVVALAVVGLLSWGLMEWRQSQQPNINSYSGSVTLINDTKVERGIGPAYKNSLNLKYKSDNEGIIKFLNYNAQNVVYLDLDFTLDGFTQEVYGYANHDKASKGCWPPREQRYDQFFNKGIWPSDPLPVAIGEDRVGMGPECINYLQFVFLPGHGASNEHSGSTSISNVHGLFRVEYSRDGDNTTWILREIPESADVAAKFQPKIRDQNRSIFGD
jgi:hypothetical protein